MSIRRKLDGPQIKPAPGALRLWLYAALAVACSPGNPTHHPQAIIAAKQRTVIPHATHCISCTCPTPSACCHAQHSTGLHSPQSSCHLLCRSPTCMCLQSAGVDALTIKRHVQPSTAAPTWHALCCVWTCCQRPCPPPPCSTRHSSVHKQGTGGVHGTRL